MFEDLDVFETKLALKYLVGRLVGGPRLKLRGDICSIAAVLHYDALRRNASPDNPSLRSVGPILSLAGT